MIQMMNKQKYTIVAPVQLLHFDFYILERT
uniref:Uncharacterized protein n=1 Tax=Siphoviridae sp. cto3L1 TaxID=2827942 RepID=A0A8S5SRP6_9CAUD|nr:MAG TPA: hypothetical protein [Siphoviridae sp. cto3L1]